jgi:hypothetical protein
MRSGIYEFRNRNFGNQSVTSRVLGNKQAFAERCRAGGLAVAPLYLEFENRKIIHHDWKEDSLPPIDLNLFGLIPRGQVEVEVEVEPNPKLSNRSRFNPSRTGEGPGSRVGWRPDE